MRDVTDNPVVLLTDDGWHIVEGSRQSTTGRCGRRLTGRRAHSRLHTIGRENLCIACLRLHDAGLGPNAHAAEASQ